MFGLGMGELMVILVLALLFLGPKRLPDVASSLGKAIRSFRKATRELGDQLEVDEEVKQPFRELQAALRDEPAPLSVMKQTPAPALASVDGTQPKPAANAAPVAVAAGPLEVKPALETKPALEAKPSLEAQPAAHAGDDGKPHQS